MVNCTTGFVGATPTTGTATLTIDSMHVTGGVYVSTTNINPPAGPLEETLTITGATTIDGNGGSGGIFLDSFVSPTNVTVNIASQVNLGSTGVYGALQVYNNFSGNIDITNAATVTSTNVYNASTNLFGAAISATSLNGAITLTNSGNVTTTTDLGLYAVGNTSVPVSSSDPQPPPMPVNIINSGNVQAYMAGIRDINYDGTIFVQNSGTVTSTFKQAIVAYDYIGDVTVANSGNLHAYNNVGLLGESEAGSVTISNSAPCASSRQ